MTNCTKKNNYQVVEEEDDEEGGGGEDDDICSLFGCPDDICADDVEELSAARSWYCWRRRLTDIEFVGFEIVVGDWERWLRFGDIKFKCCIKFCRVNPDEFVVWSSPPVDGNWNTIFAWDVLVVKPSVVGSINDDDFIFDAEPADDVDEPDIVRAGTSTARGVCVVSFGSVFVTLNDLIRCNWAAISGEISWSILIVGRENDDVEEFVRLYGIFVDCIGVCWVFPVVVVSAIPVGGLVPGVNVRIRTFRTWPGRDVVREAMICWIYINMIL